MLVEVHENKNSPSNWPQKVNFLAPIVKVTIKILYYILCCQ